MQDINFTWPQGEDLYIDLRYKEGPSQSKAVAVNLASGYSAQMSIASPAAPTNIPLTLASGGAIALSTGVNEPNIRIDLNRSHTLTGGVFAAGGAFVYDLFLRNDTTGDQIKVMEGTINVRKSVTQWA